MGLVFLRQVSPARWRASELIAILGLLIGIGTLVAGAFLLGDPDLGLRARASLGPIALALMFLGVAVILGHFGPVLRLFSGAKRKVIESSAPQESSATYDGAFAEPHLVAMRLLEPQTIDLDNEMSLADAVRGAFRESQRTAAACFANIFGHGPDDIAKMYAIFIAEHVPLYGCKWPSSAVEQVSLSGPLKEFQIQDGVLILKQLDGAGTYTGLRIRAVDYPVVLARLKEPA